jgi:hypothetical protein
MVTKGVEKATILIVADDTVVHETEVLNMADPAVVDGEWNKMIPIYIKHRDETARKRR